MNKQKKLIRSICAVGVASLLVSEGVSTYGPVMAFTEVSASEGEQVIALTPENIEALKNRLIDNPNLVLMLQDGTPIDLNYLETLEPTGEEIIVIEMVVSEEPTVPETPAEPDTPAAPEDSAEADIPDTSDNPENPDTSDSPENPDISDSPDVSEETEDPDDSAETETPGEPGTSDKPESPEDPDESDSDKKDPDEDPSKPGTSEKPDASKDPDDSDKPSTPEDSDKPSASKDPEESEDPDNSTKPDHSDKPSASDKTDKPGRPEEWDDQNNSTKPEEWDDQNNSTKPEESGQPDESVTSGSEGSSKSEKEDLISELGSKPDEITVEADQFQPEIITSDGISNATFILDKKLVKLPKIVEDFRFWTVTRKYAFAKEDIVIQEKIPTEELGEETVRVVGSLEKDGLLYILKEENNGWLYVESGRVRGFVHSDEIITGEEASQQLEIYQNEAKQKAKEQKIEYTGIEDTAPMAKERIPWRDNEAFTYMRATVGQTVVEKKYAVAEDTPIEVKEEKDEESRVIGVIPQGGLCYVLEGEFEDENENVNENVNENEVTDQLEDDELKNESEEVTSNEVSGELTDESGDVDEVEGTDTSESENVIGEEPVDEPEEAVSNGPEEAALNEPEEAVSNGPEEAALNEPEEVVSNGPEEAALNEPEEVVSNGPEEDKPTNISPEKVLDKSENVLANKLTEIFTEKFSKEFANKYAEKYSEQYEIEKEWVYVESGNVRGFVKREALSYGEDITEQVEEEKEESFPLAEEKIKPEENKACYYTLTSTQSGVPSGEIRKSMVEFAAQFVGNPYVWGGTSLTEGADCSGFVQSIYKQYGYDLPRVACDQAEYGVKIPVEDALPGDLIFYAKNGYIHHVVMYAGEGKTIEAMSSKTGIVQANVRTDSAVWATRILDDNGYEYAGGGISDVNATSDMYGKDLGTFELTYYCACELCCDVETGITATGAPVVEGRTIAVDPKVIPYGTQVIIGGHIFTAEDCGGAIKGNHIDIYVNDHEKALNLGVNYANVYLRK